MIKRTGINQTLLSAYLIVGAIVLSAAIFRFDGLIELNLSLSGARVTVDGRPGAAGK